MDPIGRIALNQIAGSEFKRYASIVRDRDFHKIRVNAIDFCKMLFCLFLELVEKVAINFVTYLKIQVHGHAVKVVANTERRTAIHYPFVVFRMMIDEIENVELQLLFKSIESRFWIGNANAIGRKAIKSGFKNCQYLVTHGDILLLFHKISSAPPRPFHQYLSAILLSLLQYLQTGRFGTDAF